MSEIPLLSVVIPTLGGGSLQTTIRHLNAGTLVPDEILVCIPAQEAARMSALNVRNVRIIVTDCRGQVAQRAAGFRQASNELVMQLDDDIAVDKTCLEHLMKEMNENGPHCAVAPTMRWLASNQPVNKQMSPPVLSKIFYWVLNGSAGARPGTVTKAGTEIGVYAVSSEDEPVAAEWLPGGCVLHRSQNLIKDDFFPFDGKAFCEDLIHSFLLRNSGVRLVVSRRAVVFLERPEPSRDSLQMLRSVLRDEFRARRYYVKLSSRSSLRMYFYYLARIVKGVASLVASRSSSR